MNATVKELGKRIVGLIPDKMWLSYRFRRKLGYPMDWKDPKTFNQKLQWLKVYDRKPIYSTMVDKYEAKKYVAGLIGEEYIIPTLGVWDSFDEIDFDALPERFVLKCTHDSGGLAIVKDKAKFDKEAARKQFQVALKRNPYPVTREWPYKNVKPRIIAEQYMEDAETRELRDYKFFAFDGTVKVFYITSGRKAGDRRTDYFDMDGNHLDIQDDDKNAEIPPAMPKNLQRMKEIAAELSKEIAHLRVDFYEVNGKIYVGELTFYYLSGFVPFKPKKWDSVFGEWIDLSVVRGKERK